MSSTSNKMKIERKGVMRVKNVVSLIMLMLLTLSAQAERSILVLDGVYQGENIYIDNPEREEGFGRTVSKILVNDKVTTDEIQSSLFMIDFSSFQFEIGDKIEIKIVHDKNSMPKVVNPDVIKAKNSIDTESICVENVFEVEKTIQKNYIVEQFKNNEWIKVCEVKDLKNSFLESLSTKKEFFSGENLFRVYKESNYMKQLLSEQTSNKESNAQLVNEHNIKIGTVKPNEILYLTSNTQNGQIRKVWIKY